MAEYQVVFIYPLINNLVVEVFFNTKMVEGVREIDRRPFAMSFKDYPDVLAEFKAFLQDYQKSLTEGRANNDQGKIVEAFFRLAAAQGKDYITVAMVANELNLEPGPVGKVLKSMKITTQRSGGRENRATYIIWQPRIFRKLLKRYILEPDDYAELFSENGHKPAEELTKTEELDTNF